MTTLIRGGTVVNADRAFRADVLIEGDTIARAACINREMEQLIRQQPAQYLWGYNRYKHPAGAEPPPQA